MNQKQREALVDLLLLGMFADGSLKVSDDQKLLSVIDEIGWQSYQTPDLYFQSAIAKARDAADTEAGTLARLKKINDGLDNDEISLCDAVITIPTADFASINLAQAVLIASYEWFRVGDATPLAQLEQGPLQRKPTRTELIHAFEHLERELLVQPAADRFLPELRIEHNVKRREVETCDRFPRPR